MSDIDYTPEEDWETETSQPQCAVANGSELPKEEASDPEGALEAGDEQPKKDVEGFDGIQNQDAQQYLNNYKAHKTGISHDEMVQVYSNWAEDYDKDLCPGRYNGPEIAAQALANYYEPDVRSDILILDVAAGTGRVGEELFKLGFRNFDAVEPSEGMLKKLLERNIYRETFQSAVGHKKINSIPSDTYDSLVIAGGMGEGHIPVKAVDEMIRMVKPGGTIFIVMREEYLSYVQEYANRLEPHFDELQEQGLWNQISREIVKGYSFNKNGVVFGYEVLQ